tara:strand:- start:30 stop:308 length:279 start_codon:yes stop_codon:yes gene_type:complete
MRNLILAAYDVQSPKRLKDVRLAVTDWAHGGQKSVWECFASKYSELILTEVLQNCLDPGCDRLALFRPDAGKPRSLGKGSISEDSTFILMGN